MLYEEANSSDNSNSSAILGKQALKSSSYQLCFLGDENADDLNFIETSIKNGESELLQALAALKDDQAAMIENLESGQEQEIDF